MFAQRFFEPYVVAEQESEMRMHLTEKRAHPDSLAKLHKQIDCSSTNVLSGVDMIMKYAPVVTASSGCFLLLVFMAPHEVTMLLSGLDAFALSAGLFSWLSVSCHCMLYLRVYQGLH